MNFNVFKFYFFAKNFQHSLRTFPACHAFAPVSLGITHRSRIYQRVSPPVFYSALIQVNVFACKMPGVLDLKVRYCERL